MSSRVQITLLPLAMPPQRNPFQCWNDRRALAVVIVTQDEHGHVLSVGILLAGGGFAEVPVTRILRLQVPAQFARLAVLDLAPLALAKAVAIPVPGVIHGVGNVVHGAVRTGQVPGDQVRPLREHLGDFVVAAPAGVFPPGAALGPSDIRRDRERLMAVSAPVVEPQFNRHTKLLFTLGVLTGGLDGLVQDPQRAGL